MPSGRSPSGQTLKTCQIVYVTSDADKLFLRQEACTALRMISENFPAVGETLNLSKTTALDEDPAVSQQTIPDLVLKLLQVYHIQHKWTPALTPHSRCPCETHGRRQCQACHPPHTHSCITSLAKRCERWSWPWCLIRCLWASISGWMSDLVWSRPILIGCTNKAIIITIITWCHCMVMCAKKNGKPSLTMDFQALNLHAPWETHHPSGTFHLRLLEQLPHCSHHPDDCHLTTFITPWRCYRSKTAPQQGYELPCCGWQILKLAQHQTSTQVGSKGLIDCLGRTFGTFGIPDVCATDDGPEFTVSATCLFLEDWGVHQCLSSVAQPHSNCRAEIGVKTV